ANGVYSVPGLGELTVDLANKTWAFKPTNGVDNDDSEFNFTVTVTDADGDVHSDTHTISIKDGNTPAPSGDPIVLGLQEADLPGPDSAMNQVAFTSVDALSSIAFGDTGAIQVSGLTETLTWTVNPTTGVLEGKDSNNVALITLTLSSVNTSAGTANVTARLHGPLAHADSTTDPDDAVAETISITGIKVTATDSDGSEGDAQVTVQ
ncbi:hypothetical protein M3P05_20680, partial [Sansalvadorimonas sp. 2012CJ34-2]